MPSAEVTSTQASPEPATGPAAPGQQSPHATTADHQARSAAAVGPEAPDLGARIWPQRAARGGRGAAAHATARWLRRALADSARGWALAAGVPPEMYPATDIAQVTRHRAAGTGLASQLPDTTSAPTAPPAGHNLRSDPPHPRSGSR